MKTVILAGGLGTRLSEYTDLLPKPMVRIGDKPILWHIMQRYAMHGYCDFVLALGYKQEVVKQYFASFATSNSDFSICLRTGRMETITSQLEDWKVSLIDTGLSTMTGGRVRRLSKTLGNEDFMLTYGDGVADVDIGHLLDFHRSHQKMVTMTVVRPVARFGHVDLEADHVKSFSEKPQVGEGWINGGFFVIKPEFLDLIRDDDTFLEKDNT